MGTHLGHSFLGSPEGGLRSGVHLLLHSQPMLCPFVFCQYACGIEAEVVGKPSPEYFRSALKEMAVEAHEVGWPLSGVCVWTQLRRGNALVLSTPAGRPWGLRWVQGLGQPWRLGSERGPFHPRELIFLERGRRTTEETY